MNAKKALFTMELLGIFLCSCPLYAQDEVLDLSSGWRFSAGYALGYADYSEYGNVFVVESDWRGWNSTINLKAETRMGPMIPYARIRLFKTENGVEEWIRDGRLTQINDMKIVGGDFSLGVSTSPFDFYGVNVTPRLGIISRFQDFERKNFALIDESRRAIFGRAESVNELVQTYGFGGGLLLQYFFSPKWLLAGDTEVYGLFFSTAENDFFDAKINGNSGLFGSSGIFSESSVMLVRILKNPQHRIGIRLNADLQWIEGGTSGSDFRNDIVEWPENRLRNLALDVYWRGTF